MKSSPMMVYVASGRLLARATQAMMISVGSAQIRTKDSNTNGMSRRLMNTQDHRCRSTSTPKISILDCSSRENKDSAVRVRDTTTITLTKNPVATVEIIQKGRTLMVTSRLVPHTETIGETSTRSTILTT